MDWEKFARICLIIAIIVGLCIVGALFNAVNNDNGNIKGSDDCTYTIVVIDSCEYIKTSSYNGLAHKGNCKYCNERKNNKIN